MHSCVFDVLTGIWHEIQRPDSRTYININTANVEDDEAGNFFVLPEQVADTHGTPYDFASLMHYDAFVSNVSVISNSFSGCNGSYTPHGTGNGTGTGNNGFLYYAMYCTHHTETGNGTRAYCFLLCQSHSLYPSHNKYSKQYVLKQMYMHLEERHQQCKGILNCFHFRAYLSMISHYLELKL